MQNLFKLLFVYFDHGFLVCLAFCPQAISFIHDIWGVEGCAFVARAKRFLLAKGAKAGGLRAVRKSWVVFGYLFKLLLVHLLANRVEQVLTGVSVGSRNVKGLVV
jgi:hypothetical protein